MCDGKKPSGGYRKAASMPYIMPDGRPLGAFLAESILITPQRRSNRKRRDKEHYPGWSSAVRPSSAPPKAAAELSPVEAAELWALQRVGQRRQRRWLNDKLLRDMAPPLTAADMASLFKPVPFGEARASAFTLAAAPEHAPLWDLFRSVDSDKQQRVLQKWEEHVVELQRAGVDSGPLNAATAALAGWARVSSKARRALRCAPRQCVEDLEAPVLAFAGAAAPGEELVLELEDSFHRLLTHGLAEYHSLQSFGRGGGAGGRQVVARQRQALPPPAPAMPLETADAALITCADVLWLLDAGGGLTSRALNEAVFGVQTG